MAAPAPSRDYLRFLAPFGPAITSLSLAVRKLVLEEAPEATELLYDAYNAVAAGYSFTGRPSDAFIHIATYPKWVNLGFNRGSLLKDPEKALQGSGRWVRHVRIQAVGDLEAPYIRKFVQAAIANAERPTAAPPARKSIIRAIYPKKRRPL